MSNDECHTPDELFDKLPFNFTLDAAATDQNTKCNEYFTKKDDALKQSWKTNGWVWLNPPYSRAAGGIENWVVKAFCESKHCSGVVCLTICDVSTGTRDFAWHYATEIVELTPRINFQTPGWKGKRSGGFQAYQLIIFCNAVRERHVSRWHWKRDNFSERVPFK